MGLIAAILAACSGSSGVVKDVDAAINQVPGVVATTTTYKNTAGMTTTMGVRVTADSGADLKTILDGALRAFAKSSASVDGSVSVAFYVFPSGAENDGIGPEVYGMSVSPSVDQIRQYAGSNN
ncbi:hypothetical protein QO003_003283 [Arthrobacter silviterrae]|uniref:Uncharacterized protein n=1 Tax=Arthrobacter silviterrae TaxID=2026658 RepID=A0ABX0DEG2_9MICC|nr:MULTISPECIES: hypothetical protein [Arthrobacter]MCU6480830.1 hypothetical protein [Arthrobacter sp. A2-55]MDQ0278980.1 hypothetical protein [Arthrobacter silviterrae]NGN85333.1 hypothetical protein [Arthrobacter silviterrae]